MDGLGWYPSGAGLRSAGACRRDRKRACRFADVLEDRSNRRCFGDEGDDLHVGTAVRDACCILSHLIELDPIAAAHRAMAQVTGPVIATTLALLAVFVPVGFLPGITGELYRQFAVTITACNCPKQPPCPGPEPLWPRIPF